MTVAVPYRTQGDPLAALAESFFLGVASHDAAAAVWDEHLDESV